MLTVFCKCLFSGLYCSSGISCTANKRSAASYLLALLASRIMVNTGGGKKVGTKNREKPGKKKAASILALPKSLSNFFFNPSSFLQDDLHPKGLSVAMLSEIPSVMPTFPPPLITWEMFSSLFFFLTIKSWGTIFRSKKF